MRLPVAICLLILACSPRAPQTRAEKGVIRLPPLNESATLRLDGEWEFYRRRHILPHGLTGAVPEYLPVPGIWNDAAQKPLSGYGFGTYRLKIFLSETQGANGISLLMPSISTSYRLFVNGRPALSVGEAGVSKETSRPAFRTQLLRLPAATGSLYEIVFHVSNFSHRDGGIWNSVEIGSDAAVEKRREANLFGDFFLTGAIFIMALYHLILFLLRRRDVSPLWFGLFCLLIASHIFFVSEFSGFTFFPFLAWETGIRYVYVIWPLALLTFSFYATQIFPAVGFEKLYRVLKLSPLFFIPAFILLPFEYIPIADLSLEALTGSVMLIGLYVVVKALRTKRTDALVYLCGFIVFVTCYVVDALATNHVIYFSHTLLPAGLLTFLIAQSFLLAKRFGEAERANALKDKFVALVSHDLRSPVIGMRQILKMLPGIDSTREKAAFSELIAAGEKSMASLAEMIDQVLDLTRVQGGRIRPLLNAANLADAVRAAEAKVAFQAKHKNITVILSLPETISAYTDAAIFSQCMQNLLHNAVKFCRSGDSVTVAYRAAGGGHLFSVTDSGPGIQPDLLPNLFRADLKTSSTGTGGEIGNGLGLPLCHEMISALGGRISITSEAGKGTAVTVRLSGTNAP